MVIKGNWCQGELVVGWYELPYILSTSLKKQVNCYQLYFSQVPLKDLNEFVSIEHNMNVHKIFSEYTQEKH